MIIDTIKLAYYCTVPTEELLGRLSVENHGEHGSSYIYIDNDTSVLAVAHADVHPDIANIINFEVDESTHSKASIVKSPYLDDRLGIYAILETLPEMGINLDVLITDGEETGQSTASLFSTVCPKKYNWIVEFDRKGEDVVLYNYSCASMEQMLAGAGFTFGSGTASDISHMKSLGIACFNVGIGYQKAHSENCFANLRVFERQIHRFTKFFRQNRDNLFMDENRN